MTPGRTGGASGNPVMPSSVAANGAPMRVPRSRTRIPSSAPGLISEGLFAEFRVAIAEDVFHRALRLALFECVERRLRVVLELVDHEVVLERVTEAGEI